MGNDKCSCEECMDKYVKVDYICIKCGRRYCEFHAQASEFMCECVIVKTIFKKIDGVD